LSTLDVFELPLQASLVTLSACETGRHVVGGGDEILGLTRAFLAAGAASLLISHWAVEDVSTRLLMRRFYDLLAGGARKDDSLRDAQRWFVTGDEHPFYAHPYFWAPFYLLGAAGAL
jgi:CHAT domain-containing protein